MNSDLFSIDSLLDSVVRPTNSRPILGSNRDFLTNYGTERTVLPLRKNWTPNSDADNSSGLSPIGSPLKYSPLDWPQSVHTFNRNSIHNSRGNPFSDEDSNDSKYEFETNGIDVPLETNNLKPFVRSVPMQTPASQYQLFHGFSYAKMPTVADIPNKDVKNKAVNRRRIKTQTFCSFCKNNNETPEMYNSHVVKDPSGRTTCPVLRDYDCPKCRSGGGDNGHTIRYCPLNRPGLNDYIPSVIKQLKNSRSADGKKRTVV